MTITTDAAHTATDIEFLTTIGAAPKLAGHGFDVTAPSADLLTILDDPQAWSGIQRGIAAAAALRRMVPPGVQVEERDMGLDRKIRGVFLHKGGPDDIAMYFLDATAEVSVHIDDYQDGENFDQFMRAGYMFEMVRAYYWA